MNENASRPSEEGFRATFERAAVGIAHIAMDGGFLRANAKLCDILGRSEEELLNVSLAEVTHAEDRIAGISNFQSLLKGETSVFSRERRLLRRDESTFCANLTVSLAPQTSSDPQYFITVIEDVSERKATGAVLRLTQHSVDSSASATFWISRDGRFSYVNDAGCRLLGRSREEVLRLSVPDIDPDIPVEGWEAFYKQVKEAGHNRFEGRIRRANGTMTPVEVAVSHLEFDGQEHLFAHIQDISARKKAEEELEKYRASLVELVEERTAQLAEANQQLQAEVTARRQHAEVLRQSEQRYRDLYGAMTDALFVHQVDTDGSLGNFIEVNDVACSRLGYSRDELLRMSPGDIDAPDSGVDVPAVAEALARGESVTFEQVHLSKDGRRIPVEIHARSFLLDGERSAVMSIVRDITERKRILQARAESERSLRLQHKVLTRIAESKVLVQGSLVPAFRQVTEAAVTGLGIARASVWLYNEDKSAIRCFDMFDDRSGQHAQGAELKAVDYPAYFAALQGGRLISATDAAMDSRTAELTEVYLRPNDIASMLDVAILVRGERVGVVCHEAVGASRNWTIEEESFARSITDFVALAMESNHRRRAEEELDKIFNHTAEGLVYVDTEFTIRKVNQTFLSQWGLTEGGALGRKCREMFRFGICDHVEGREAECPLVRAKQGKASGEQEVTFTFPDGTTRVFIESSTPFHDGDGKLRGLLKSFRDITERKRAEEHVAQQSAWSQGLQKAGERLSRCRTIDEIAEVAVNAPTELMGFSTAWMCVPASEAGYRVIAAKNISAAELETSHDLECVRTVLRTTKPQVVPDIIARPPYAHCGGAARRFGMCGCATFPVVAGGACLATLTVCSADKSPKSTIARAAPLIEVFCRQLGYVWQRCLAMAETQKLLLAIEQSPATVIITDPEGTIEYVNPKFVALTGFTAREVIGQKPSILKSDFHPPEFHKDMWTTISSGREWRGNICNRKKNGELYWESASISPIRNAEGEISHYVAVKEDVTEQRRVAQELQAAKDAAESASRAKSDFLANMSHELRTPLNAVIGFSEILRDQTFGQLNEKQGKYVDHVLTSGRHLLDLINDILDLAKVEAGKMELDLDDVAVGKLIENSVVFIKEKAMRHGIALELDVGDELKELALRADERKLKQIMFNLLSNAAKFTPDGGRITVSGQVSDGEIIVSVADTGIGIAAEDQERVFYEFEQIDSSYGKEQQGTGLGLALTKRLVELHGGRLWLESEGKNKGSTFSFSVPVVRPERDE